jgi:D-beta-D-heptose 7-phosphate kinase/D-beta-D-heptose 1-phosphate adenosyltransferase
MRRKEPEAGRPAAILDAFPASRVVVVGDLIVDHYLWGEVNRISPEAPVPVVDVRRESRTPGGAANVASNIRALGGRVELLGVSGDDASGRWLADELSRRGIGTDGIVRMDDRSTTVKSRVVAHGQQVVRFDREVREPLSTRATAALKRNLESRLEAGTTLVVSDYGKGVVGTALLNFLREKKAALGLKVLVDPKSRHFAGYRGFTLVTPNQKEAELAAGLEITDDESLHKAAAKLLETLETGALLVTRGEHGMALFEGGLATHMPTAAREVYDVTGAGDTVVATLALAVAAGSTLRVAAWLANLAAGIVVGEVGTSTVGIGQLRGAVEAAPEGGLHGV